MRYNKTNKRNVEVIMMNKIKQIREQVGMSRAELSRLSTVPSRTIDDWENNRRIPRDVYQLKKISDALNVTIEDLIEWE